MYYLMRIDGGNIPHTRLNLVFVSFANYPSRIIYM